MKLFGKKNKKESDDEEEDDEPKPKKGAAKARGKDDEDDEEGEDKPKSKGAGKLLSLFAFGKNKKKKADDEEDEDAKEEKEEDAEEGEGKAKGRLGALLEGRGKLIAIGAAAVLVIGGVLGGAGWWFLGSKSKPEAGSALQAGKGAPPPGGLTPPPRGGPAGDAPQPLTPVAAGPGAAASLNTMATSQGPGGGLSVPAIHQQAFARVPDSRAAPQPLGTAPDPALVEQRSDGPLPKVARDGRKAWQVYARPSDPREARPRVALILSGMGLSRAATIEAIRKLPGPVTMAFDPYARGLNDWVVRARQAGHEVLLVLPMEPVGFPLRDEGPLALLTTLKPPENIKKLEAVLTRMTGYVGVKSTPATQFAVSEESLKPILEAVKARGLMFVDGGEQPRTLVPRIAAQIGLPRAVSDMTVDLTPSRTAIDAKLAELEAKARQDAVVVATAHAYPVTVERLAAWIPSLEAKNIALVPVSAVADKQLAR
jgi:polysaccharide deacetylase 2 family uncharacterized protein YibQ